MKIAFVSYINWDYSIDTVYQKPLGGTQSALCYLAEKLAQNGHQVFLFNKIAEATESKNVICIPVDQVPQSLINNLDVVIITDGSFNGQVWKTKLKQNSILLFWCHYDINQDDIATLSDIEEQNIYDGFIFVSEWQKQRFIEQFHLDEKKTYVLRNAISPHFENLFPEKTSILAEKSSHLSHTYTSTPFRGLNILIDVFPQIYQQIPDTELKIFSSMKVYLTDEQKEQEKFGNLYQKCHNTEGVNYIGSIPQPELAQQLKSIHLFAYPNTFAETSCIALMEAMASGCYIITSDYGALPETASGFAELISVKDGVEIYKEQFTQKILNYAQKLHSGDIQDLENHLRKQVDFVNQNYTWSVRAKEWSEYLEHTTKNKLQSLNIDTNTLENNEINSYFYLGLIYFLEGDIETAESAWMSILLASNNFDDEFNQLLKILNEEGESCIEINEFQKAIYIYSKIHELISEQELVKPEWGVFYYNLAKAFRLSGMGDNAMKVYEKAIEIGQINEAYNDLGVMHYYSGRMEQAINIFEQQIQAHPYYFHGYFNLIGSLHKAGKVKEAQKVCQDLEQKNPEDILWKINRYLMLPFVYQNADEIQDYREKYIQGLELIIEDFERLDLSNDNILDLSKRAILNNCNFELAYQCFNHKDLQQKYCSLVQKIVSVSFPQWVQPKEKKYDGSRKIRIGYVSECMKEHIVSKLTIGWIINHNPEMFDVYCYHVGDGYDHISHKYQKKSSQFYQISSISNFCQQIINDDIDILVFLEIGMTGKMIMLSNLRLAPIQCTTWAHPETSGSSNIDYFLSSELMEPNNGQEHYSEQLIRLPNIGVCVEKPSFPKNLVTREFFKLPKEGIIYFCSQSIFKYLPYHDFIFPSIAQKVTNAKFLFLARPNPNLAEQFKNRLRIAFEQFNLNADDYCLFLPQVNHEAYLNLNLLSDVFLDSLGWSGGGTTLDAISCNLPVVTYPGEFMRGRHSYGILKMLGITETIANSEEEYIDIAVRLGNDPLWREEIREKIKANQDKVYNDLDCVKGLEKFYQNLFYSNQE